MQPKYKDKVQQIRDFPWSRYHPESISLLSLISAKEFAASLRCALKVYPDDVQLKKMAEGELQTNNLIYGDYNKVGDHWEFLDHYLRRGFGFQFKVMKERALTFGASQYLNTVEQMTNEERAMTVFSREQELPNIFLAIRHAHPWGGFGYDFYRYYLWRHIELDSGDEGHGALTKKYKLNARVLDRFYTARLQMYKGALTPV
jgi:hypothetical protein